MDSMNFRALLTLVLIALVITSCNHLPEYEKKVASIQPYSENPFYWQYKGNPVLLLGGTWQDNLFNHPVGLEEHLDILVACGGNYVRNTMSHRNEGNAFAYAQYDGKFNLDEFNDEYWQRLENFLKMTYEREIIVQMEVFDAWDHMIDHQSLGGWSKHPFNPANNINYTETESGLPTEFGNKPGTDPSGHPFFQSVPALDNNELILNYQQAYIDKMLSISFKYPNVLYCIQNESGEELAFGDYWINYIRSRASEFNVLIYTTDMRRNNDITAHDHAFLYQNPDIYTFIDISQNNSNNIPTGQLHWDRIQMVRNILKGQGIRPMNNIKIYSREGGFASEGLAPFDGDHIDGPQRFWRNIMGGCAGARFHRPHPLEGGPENHYARTQDALGLHVQAQNNIKSARMLTGEINIFSCEPRNDLLSDRRDNEAYCLAEEGKQYVLYFPYEGTIMLDFSGAKGEWLLKWLNIPTSTWMENHNQIIQGGDNLQINTPDNSQWIALMLPAE
jgi:hypothetical protein